MDDPPAKPETGPRSWPLVTVVVVASSVVFGVVHAVGGPEAGATLLALLLVFLAPAAILLRLATRPYLREPAGRSCGGPWPNPATSPGRRLKLWHLSALVAASALIFGLGRALKGSATPMGLLIISLYLALGVAAIYYAIKLGNRVVLDFENQAERRSGFERQATSLAGVLAFTVILFGLPFLVLIALSIALALITSD